MFMVNLSLLFCYYLKNLQMSITNFKLRGQNQLACFSFSEVLSMYTYTLAILRRPRIIYREGKDYVKKPACVPFSLCSYMQDKIKNRDLLQICF